ncbi:hypothetical protein [Pseudodesulfovibrio indicus]|uniref:hypothetical protein n=1 Tax=Pseudodesulfovibrio indicus TaxID=1716143 RepID=UPI00292E0654|nr:hypothetical protein [Pseudodesulfovibrio indicus]
MIYPYQLNRTPEESEAKEYVEFYRFWAWEYTKRNNEFKEIVSASKETEEYFSQIGITDFSMKAKGLTDPHSIVFFEQFIGREFTEDEYALYGRAFLGRMRARLHFGFDVGGPMPQREYSSDDILELLQKEEVPLRPGEPRERSEGARLIRQREFQEGIKVLYDGGSPIFGYDALVAIDFDRPISEIQFQIENVKKEFEIYREIERGGNSFPTDFKTTEIEKIGIQKNPNIQFKIGAENSRAVGIWIWDYIQNSENPQKRGIISEAVRTLRERFDLGRLGYDESESRVFRNILAKTQKCIDAAEVLSLS